MSTAAKHKRSVAGLAVLAVVTLMFASDARSASTGPKQIYVLPGYEHTKYAPVCRTEGADPDFGLKETAFYSCFDGNDDDDGDAISDRLAVPHWVAQEIHRSASRTIESHDWPSRWFTIDALFAQNLAPEDDSYRQTAAFLSSHPNWFERGHLAQKYLAERLQQPWGEAAAWNTHTLLNAVPQRMRFNAGIWLDLECRTGAWVNRFGHVWVISGPVFLNGRPVDWLGEEDKKELPVAIHDALFKVVVLEGADQRGYVVASIYPQDDRSHAGKETWNDARWLVPLRRIEMLTGLDFPASLDDTVPSSNERATGLWSYAVEDLDPGCSKISKSGAE